MLAASRDQLLADTKASALSLRMCELDNVVQRYTSIIGVTSLSAGFAFSAMVELDHDEYDENTTDALWYEVHAFYICTSLALLLSLYVVSTSTFAVAAGYRLALKGGQKGSLDRAVAVLLLEFRRVFAASAMAMWLMMAASVCLLWIKVVDTGFIIVSTSIYCIAFVIIGLAMYRLHTRLAIAEGDVIRGDVKAGGFDLAEVSPGRLARAEAPASAGALLSPQL